MQDREFEALGRLTAKVGMTLVLLIFLAGSLWVLNDLWSSWKRDEIQSAALWAMCGLVALIAAIIGGSAVYGLYRCWTQKVWGRE